MEKHPITIKLAYTDKVIERKEFDVDIITWSEYWDSHGKRFNHGGVKQILGANKLAFEVVETTYTESKVKEETWHWYVNGKKKDGWVKFIQVKGGKARLDVCIGAG